MENSNSIAYINVIKSIINGLNNKELTLLKNLQLFFEQTIHSEYSTLILFVKDNNLHFLTRLYMMITGRIFIVVSTSLDESSISTILSNNSYKSVVITDSINLLEKINPAFISKKNPLLNTIDISKVSELDVPIIVKPILINPATKFYMYVYDYNKKLSRILIDQNMFARLYKNLEASFAMYNINLGNRMTNDCSFVAPSDDFFLYKCLVCAYNMVIHPTSYSCHTTLLISYKNFKQLWDNLVEGTIQRRFLFNGYLHKFFGRFIIRYIIKKFEKHLSQYKKIVVLGLIVDPTLEKVVNNLNGIKVFNTYGEADTLLATNVSNKAGYISLASGLSTTAISLKETNEKSYQIMENENSILTVNKNVSQVVLSFLTELTWIQLTSTALFRKEGAYAKYIGHSFSNGICPETIESIFNNFPFIRDTVLVKTNKGNYVLFIDTKEYLLDVSRINFNTWQKILRNQVERINRILNRRDLVITGPCPLPSDLNHRTSLGLLDKTIFYEMEYIE